MKTAIAVGTMLVLLAPCRADDDIASPAVAAYLKSAEKHKAAKIEAMNSELKALKTRRKKTRAESIRDRERIKVVEAAIKEAKSKDGFVPPEVFPANIYAGYSGRIRLNMGAVKRPAAYAEIRQIIDGQSAIVEMGQRTFWMTGFSTEGLEDGAMVKANGVFYCSGSRKYETVLGGTKTVLVLESFSEKDVLPHLPEHQQESLRDQIEEENE